MKNPTHPTRLAVRATLAVALVGMTALTACDQDKLLTAPTPDVVLPGDIASKAALPSAFAAAVVTSSSPTPGAMARRHHCSTTTKGSRR